MGDVKNEKEKMIISLVVVALLALIFGNVTSNATSLTGNSVTLNVSATNSTTLNISTNKTNTTNTNTNKSSINAAVSNYANTNSKVNTAKNTANTSKLPYAGNGNVAGAIVLAVIFVGSAVYAYKKVSDYNV